MPSSIINRAASIGFGILALAFVAVALDYASFLHVFLAAVCGLLAYLIHEEGTL